MSEETTMTESPHGNSNQYLTFMLAGEEYGVEILRVQGIQGWGGVTPIPQAPDYVLGVTNLRGAIVPIVDLRKRFGLPKAEFGPTTVVIVVKIEDADEERIVGMVVDAVSEVYRLEDSDTQPAPEFGGGVDKRFIKCLSTVNEKMLILLDIDGLLRVDDIGDAEPATEVA